MTSSSDPKGFILWLHALLLQLHVSLPQLTSYPLLETLPLASKKLGSPNSLSISFLSSFIAYPPLDVGTCQASPVPCFLYWFPLIISSTPTVSNSPLCYNSQIFIFSHCLPEFYQLPFVQLFLNISPASQAQNSKAKNSSAFLSLPIAVLGPIFLSPSLITVAASVISIFCIVRMYNIPHSTIYNLSIIFHFY